MMKLKRGGAALELAVVAPLLLLFLIGVADYGRMFFTSVTISNAARAGAEYGASNPALTGDTAAINAFARADGQEAGSITVSSRRYCECDSAPHACTACSTGLAPDVYVEVTASKTVSTFFVYPGLPSTISIVRTATFRSQ